jgi:hypothetical protein
VTERPDFSRTLEGLAAALARARIPYMLVGGLALLVRGVPRLTRDVDVVVACPIGEVDRLLVALAPMFRPRVEDPQTFAEETMVVPFIGSDGTPVDVILAGLPFEHDAMARARPEIMGGVEVKVAIAEDLILMKIISERPKDREDVAGLLRARHREMDLGRLDRTITALASDIEEPEILAFWRKLRSGRP